VSGRFDFFINRILLKGRAKTFILFLSHKLRDSYSRVAFTWTVNTISVQDKILTIAVHGNRSVAVSHDPYLIELTFRFNVRTSACRE